MARDSGLKIQDSGFEIQDYKIKVWKSISRKKYQILEYQGMCPQYSYYEAFISHKNLHSPTQALFTKIFSLWSVALSVDSKSEL